MRIYGLALVLVASAIGFGSTPAMADPIKVTSTAIDMSSIVHVNDGVVNEDVVEAPMLFTIEGQAVPWLVWCIDLDHLITVGNQAPPLEYTTESLADYFPTFSMQRLENIASLAQTGYGMSGSAQNIFQSAIWSQISPGAVTSTDPAHQAAITAFGSWTGTANLADFTVLKAVGIQQSFLHYEATATPSVPEPATWAMLILGFAAVGFALRRRAKQLAGSLQAA